MAKHPTPPGGGDAAGGKDDRALQDALAFRAAVRDVKPLKAVPAPAGRAGATPRSRAARTVADPEPLEEAMPLLPSAADGVPSADAMAGADTLSFQRSGVRAQVVRRLRRGLIPVEAELDLHGLTQSSARIQLAEFLAQSRSAGRRCVRIIHGKGYRSGARGPVLKVAVDTWLRRHFDVMAFTSARPIDGGTGAVYVLLRG